MTRQKKDLVKPYFSKWQEKKDLKSRLWYFRGMPPKKAKKLLTGWPNVEPSERHNFSPKMEMMVRLAKKKNGLLGGYIIPVETGRDDARIQFTSLLIPMSEDIEMIKNLSEPDEFEKNLDIPNLKGKYYRLWWD